MDAVLGTKIQECLENLRRYLHVCFSKMSDHQRPPWYLGVLVAVLPMASNHIRGQCHATGPAKKNFKAGVHAYAQLIQGLV